MIEIIQGSPEWHALRIGKVTASRVADVVATTKSGPSASRTNYMAELLVERLTGQAPARFTNAAMDWGTATEPDARDAYAFYSGNGVELVGFVDHPTISMSGASPDGRVGGDGLIEIKCPNTATHIETLLGGTVPSKYRTQMQWQMACEGRAWCDFVSYDPRMPESMRLFVRRIEREPSTIADLEREVKAFLSDLDAKIARLRAAYDLDRALEAAQ